MVPVIALIGLAHIICGISIAISPGVALVTPLAELKLLAGGAISFILIVAGALAVASHFIPDPLKLFLIVPQQTILTIQASSLVFTLATGHYPDGYTPNLPWPRLFIMNDQIWALFCSVAHSLEVISMARSK